MLKTRVLAGRAWRRAPLGAIWFLQKMRACDELAREILGILHDRSDDEIRPPVGFVGTVVIFREHSLIAVRHAVLAQIAWGQMRRDHLQRTAPRRGRRRRSAAPWAPA